MVKSMKMASVLVSLLLVTACGSGGGGGAVIAPPVSGQTAVQTSTTGVTAAPATVSLENAATVTVPQNTTLKAADGTPVTGNVNISATYGTSATYLPATEQATLPTTSTVKAYISINIAGDQKVKTVNPPIPVTVSVPLPDATTVNVYSNDETAGAPWVKEGTATVSGGKVTLNISHFTVYALTQTNLTGGTGSTSTN